MSLASLNYKVLRDFAVKLPTWSAWAAQNGVNAATARTRHLVAYLEGEGVTQEQVEATLPKVGDPCPNAACTGHLVDRQSQFGPFIGCSEFPKCNFNLSTQRRRAAFVPGVARVNPVRTVQAAADLPPASEAAPLGEQAAMRTSPAPVLDVTASSSEAINRALAAPAAILSEKAVSDLRAAVSQVVAETEARYVAQIDDLTKRMADEIEAAKRSAVPAAAPLPPRAGVETIKSIFGVASSAKVRVFADPAAPSIDPFYAFTPAVIDIVRAIDAGRNVFLSGPHGCGKSTVFEQIGARLGRRVVVIACHSATDFESLIGSIAMREGKTYAADGALTDAVRRVGCLVIFDEMTKAPPSTLASVQGVIAARSITVPHSGEVVRFADDVVVLGTGNSMGSGDPSGLYLAEAEQDAAFLDRFDMSLGWDYLPPDVEAAALGAACAIPDTAARPYVDFAALTRKEVAAGRNGQALSFRALRAWIGALQRGMTIEAAFAATVANKMRPAYAARVVELYKAHWTGDAASAAARAVRNV